MGELRAVPPEHEDDQSRQTGGGDAHAHRHEQALPPARHIHAIRVVMHLPGGRAVKEL